MSTAVQTPTLDLSGTRPVPFGRLLKVEIRKMLDTRSGLWLMISTLAILVVVVGIAWLVIGLNDGAYIHGMDWMQVLTIPLSLLLPVLPIVSVTSEWGQRSALTTFTLEANRVRVVAAKLGAVLVLALGTMVFAVLVGAVANVVGSLVGGYDVVWNMDWRVFGWTVVVQALYFCMAFALGTLILNSPGAIAVFYLVALLLPMMVYSALYAFFGWARDLIPWIDMQYALTPMLSPGAEIEGGDYARAVVSVLIWVVAPLVLGMTRILRSEVK